MLNTFLPEETGMVQEGPERSTLTEQCGEARTRTPELRYASEDTGMPHAKTCRVQRQAADRTVFPSLTLHSF